MIKNFLRKILPRSFLEKFWHYPKAALAAFIYGKPAKNLKVIAVAGSKGKTTTAHLIAHLLEKAQKKVALISTASLKIGKKEKLNDLKMTTPPSFFLQKFIKEAVKEGCQYLVLEVSSHALKQFRTFAIPFETIVLTNLFPDHLEYHPSKEDYQKTHLKLINPNLKYLIFNGDDPDIKKIFSFPLKKAQKISFGLDEKNDLLAQKINLTEKGISFELKTKKGSILINSPLLGKFNLYNLLGAAAFAISQNFNLSFIKEALESFSGAPGRGEVIETQKKFKVIVDYAHSPNSLKSLFEALKPVKKRKVIVVFGACGERDPKQRPLMGEIIDKNSDYFILTNDDPYSEDPEKIAKDLLSGIKRKKLNENLFKILDRKKAIEKAISLAQENDLVLILGKGAEQWQVFKDKKIPWDDRKIVKEILQKL